MRSQTFYDGSAGGLNRACWKLAARLPNSTEKSSTYILCTYIFSLQTSVPVLVHSMHTDTLN